MVVVGNYSSTHMPEEGPAGEISAVHALTRGLQGPVAYYDCQELGHIITNCPHRVEGTSGQSVTLVYN